ncbi:MAG TPA: acetate/propionate family kinase [Steroidobacteraceae bacterium]|jgi:acetate kinase|nr:acetate/propionate family kinase [Steroidobacteraceae bacterium]
MSDGAGGRAILVLNAGSSSIKFCVFRLDGRELLRDLRGQVAGLGTSAKFVMRRDQALIEDRPLAQGSISHAGALEQLLDAIEAHLGGARIVGVGHRVVHGGLEFMAPTVLTGEVLERLDRYVPLAPLHQPHNLAAIRVMLERLPGTPEFACFDTAFHRTIPEVAQLFALPPRFAAAGIRRYGFHGLSYEYIASRLPALDGRAASGRTVVFHLGNGASMCAMVGGRSVATTMGFTAVDGLPMGTRCGSLDPGVVLFLMDELALGPREIERLIYHESGLFGMSGVSSDVRDLLASDAPAAATALDVFVYRAGRELGSLAAALGGLDAIVFTAGIGENQREIRARICRDAEWLGVELDEAANARHGPRISTPRSRVLAFVVPTDEESMIARHVQRLLGEP